MVYEQAWTLILRKTPSSPRRSSKRPSALQRAREAARKARDLTRRKSALDSGRTPRKAGRLHLQGQHPAPKSTSSRAIPQAAPPRKGGTGGIQAILPLWGKMLNVEKARLDKVYGNEKLMPVVLALGCGIGEDLDLAKLRYGKIIIMADADVDGSHIRTLLLTFFFRYMRPLVEQGHIYFAQPPLFRVARGKKFYYAFSEKERDKYIAELSSGTDAKVDVQRYKGLGEMDPYQLWETTMDPSNRTIVRVNLEDAAQADTTFTILMGDKVEPRKEFIERNARFVRNLDI